MRDGLIEHLTPPLPQHGFASAGSNAAPDRLAGDVVPLPAAITQRPHVRGKFLFVGDQTFWVRGVTYGTFRPDSAGAEFPAQALVQADFRAMAAAGVNCVRLYVVPPAWLLDLAGSCGLRVMVGLPWEQHVAFLDDRAAALRIIQKVRAGIRACAAHPAVLCYAIGNEIPASVVRWHGKRRIEAFLAELTAAAKREDPTALITYVNFPTTEYLELPFVDIVSFNVYLESKERYGAYLARLQNLAGERPLVMTEIGLDSRRNGEGGQAASLDWQIATAFEAGCAGVFVFAWTDEWFRGGHNIEDWDFGLTTRTRQPKSALATVAARFAAVPFPADRAWPKISVIVCSYNGAATIGQTLTELERLDYPDYEVIVVDDGSTDDTSAIAGKHDVRLIRTANDGLSSARNVGLHAASGEIVAYIDDDAYPDRHWLTYLAAAFARQDHAGVGGPNLTPAGDGVIAHCVAHAPGGPVHVLLSDDVAEHIPGVNMAYRRERLLEVGGFDPRFRVAGDDVDICWRLQDRGWTLGFAATAVVWHHRRKSLRAYFRQQRGYAKAEALLQQKWPGRYNDAGHPSWRGRLYGTGLVESFFRRPRIYHGLWGSALFQSIYQPAPTLFAALPLMPEWYVLLSLLAAMALLGFSWSPLFWLAPVLALGVGLTIVQAVQGARKFRPEPGMPFHPLGLRLIVACLHLVQPAARLIGRIAYGLGPWRRKRPAGAVPVPRYAAFWSEDEWQGADARLTDIEQCVDRAGAASRRGGDFDAWDLEISGGLFGSVRSVAMIEEHGGARQLLRLRSWPRVPGVVVGIVVALAALVLFAASDGAVVAALGLALGAAFTSWMAYADCAAAMCNWQNALDLYAHQRRLTPMRD